MESDHHDHGCEKSLPGMGIPKWMKKQPERYEYADFCASPPSNDDGFFHFGSRNTQRQRPMVGLQKPDCPLRKSNSTTDTTRTGIDSNSSTYLVPTIKDCKTSEATSFFKTVSSSSLVNLASSQAAFLVLPTHSVTTETSNSTIADKLNERCLKSSGIEAQLSVYKPDFTDSAPTVLDKPIPITVITSPDYEKNITVKNSKTTSNSLNSGSKSKRSSENNNVNSGTLVVATTTDDVTPCTTPAVTPSCSPQMSRRIDNPFFTGGSTQSDNNKNNGSWLFRPASSSSDADKTRSSLIYEMKSDQLNNRSNVTPTPANNVKPRYVPKPSQLRELNFWSPTSM